MVPAVVENYEKERLDALILLGGGGTAKNALRLHEAGLNVLTLPKTIDNDIAMTDTSFGFATAMEIATEAIACDTITPMVVTNKKKFGEITPAAPGPVGISDTVVTVSPKEA